MTTLHTVGHGNRAAGEFIELLQQAGIRYIVDVRAFPASRRHPHFERSALEGTLHDASIAYTWEGEALGGRRRPSRDSPNVALRNASFRAYADHMLLPAFRSALDRVLAAAAKHTVAVMCAERLPWQCHRYLISDSVVARGFPVLHIVSQDTRMPHKLSALARAEGDLLIYDKGAQPDLLER
ncbi:MAG: DUF488 domain-containing protein [Betaproteobacteria bacterium]